MNPKLMAALRAKKPKVAETKEEAAEAPMEKNAEYHHEQVRRHLDKGLSGTRRSAKIHMKMAKYHHDCACGRNHDNAS